MTKTKRTVIEYKYPGEGWTQYDWTMDSGWAKTQLLRCQAEHEPKGAQVRVRLA